jgi:peptidoglycan/xylan/chitin deacetylase (PgdA/CDA1 family)
MIGDSPDEFTPKGRTQRLVEIAERAGLVRALQPLHDRRRDSLIVLAYHRVRPASAQSYPLDLDLISATPEQFEWQMGYIRRHLNPVSLSQVVAHLQRGTPLPPQAVAVTFDDGYGDTYHHAYPILQRYGIRATIFVTTGYVDSGEPFWFELAAFLTQRVEPRALEFPDSGLAFPVGNSMLERRRSLREVHAALKALPNARRIEIIAGWAQRFAHQLDPDEIARSCPISWAQVAEMAAAGIEFGSHTVTHPNLTQLAEPDLHWELTESKRVLEQRLGETVPTLAYPIGTTSAFNDRVVAATERAGFKLALSYVAGVNWVKHFERFRLRRHGVGLGTTPGYFRALTSIPSWLN